MTGRWRFVLTWLLVLVPSVSWALMETQEGNAPLPEANYDDWPGLIHALNDESRVMLTWVNGHEDLDFVGDVKALNRVLAAFGKTEVPKLEVMLLPRSVDLLPPTDPPARKVDWQITVYGGIAGMMVRRQKLEPAMPLHPVLTIYVDETLDLTQLQMPEKVSVSDRESRKAELQPGLASADETLKMYSEYALQALEPELPPDQRLAYERRVARISAWVSHLQDSRKTE